MRTIWLYVAVCFVWIQAEAQKEDYIWMMGAGAMQMSGLNDSTFVLDFNTNPPQVRTIHRHMSVGPSFTNICSPEGQLLLYSNASVVFDSSFQQIANGSGISEGYWYWQHYPHGYPTYIGAMLLPHPTDTISYYLFHQYKHYPMPSPSYLESRYSIIRNSEVVEKT